MKKLQKFLAMLIIMVMLSSVVLPTFVLADESGEGGVYLPVVEVNYEQNEKELSPVEKMFAMLVNGIANALNYIVARAIGQQVVIDDLVFNEYPPTRIDYFKGDCTLNDAVEKVKQESRRYAKRQLSWLRRDSDINWILWKKTPQIDNAVQLSTEFLNKHR